MMFDGRIEDVSGPTFIDDKETFLASIAISLKRIADAHGTMPTIVDAIPGEDIVGAVRRARMVADGMCQPVLVRHNSRIAQVHPGANLGIVVEQINKLNISRV